MRSILDLSKQDALDFSRLLMENLTPVNRARLSGAIYRVVSSYFKRTKESANLLNLVLDQNEWGKAHAVFDEIRMRTLRAEKSWLPRAQDLSWLFCEIVAKIHYNATDPSDPFDENAYLWLIPNLAAYLQKVRGRDKSRRIEEEVFHVIAFPAGENIFTILDIQKVLVGRVVNRAVVSSFYLNGMLEEQASKVYVLVLDAWYSLAIDDGLLFWTTGTGEPASLDVPDSGYSYRTSEIEGFDSASEVEKVWFTQEEGFTSVSIRFFSKKALLLEDIRDETRARMTKS